MRSALRSLFCTMLALAFVPALVHPAEAASAARRDLPPFFSGKAFDTCSAPGPTLLRAWRRASPYGAVGLYIGGDNRACSQPLLNRSYVRAVDGMGWRMLPLYVGAQAPCVTQAHARTKRINSAHAFGQGQWDGQDAVNAARSLGLAPGTPVYLDMEAYSRDRGRCSLAVLRYTTGWSRALHEAGYLAGFYSSANSGIADLASLAAPRRDGQQPDGMPDVVWYARWDHRSSTDGYRALPRGQWSGHRRVHQYVGNTRECHGGRCAVIDRNAMDAPVALVE